jgi:RNA ligase
MKFLRIESLNDLLPFVEDKKEIHVRKTDDGGTTVIYRFLDSKTFDSHGSLEARGIMFDDLDRVISRPLHKFHNLDSVNSGVNTYTRDYILANKDQVMAIYEKLDGSMISTANFNGTVRLRSKSSYDTDVCKLAYKIYNQDRDIQFLCMFCVERGLTATFELTHPQSRIVLAYSRPELRLLHIRDNVTGEYVTDQISAAQNVRRCPQVPVTRIEEIISKEHLEGLKDEEGYVIQFRDGDMVKVKCPWYVGLHRVVTFLRERDIASMVLEERLDDVYSAFTHLGIDLEPIENIEIEIKNELIQIADQVELAYREVSAEKLSRKDVALRYDGWELRSLLFNMIDGKEPKYKEYYKRNVLDDRWGLNVVGNVGEKE